MAPNPKCYAEGTYTINSDKITYITGTVDTFSISGDQLTRATLNPGPPFFNAAGSYSVLDYLDDFDTSEYTTACK